MGDPPLRHILNFSSNDKVTRFTLWLELYILNAQLANLIESQGAEINLRV